MKSIFITLMFTIISISGYAQTTDTVETATIKVNGITCNGDMPLIKKKLLKQEGVDEATYSQAKSGTVTFTAKYHSSVITERKFCEIIEASPSCDNPNLFPYKVNNFKADTTKKQ